MQKAMSALPPKADIICDKVRIMKPVTIASVRAHGVQSVRRTEGQSRVERQNVSEITVFADLTCHVLKL